MPQEPQASESITEHQPNNLAEALSMRYPIVWIHTVDTVEVIERIRAHIELYKDLSFYVFNALAGLQKYNFETHRFETFLVQDIDALGQPIQHPLFKIDQVLELLQNDVHATLFIANAEQYEDRLNDVYTYISFAWRDSWLNDTVYGMPVQIILSSTTQPQPPKAVQSFVPTVDFSLPSKSELSTLLTFISERTKTNIDINKTAQAARGLTTFEAIQLFHSMIARSGTIDIKALENLTFQRLASRLGIEIMRPQVRLEDVAGGENVKKILETSLWIRNNPEEAKKLGHNKGLHRFLFLGLPGSGKSFMCEGASNALGLNLIRTGVSQQLSKWHGESENNMIALFDQIRALDPVCVWCDEFGRDVQGGQSSHIVDAGSTGRMHAIFLTGLQELAANTYFFAAANDISTLPPEMLRSERFDKIFFVGFPTLGQRFKILSDALVNVDHKIEIEKISESTPGFTGAELMNALSMASSYSISELREMTNADMNKALKGMRDRLWIRYQNYVIGEYTSAYDQYEWASDDQHAEAQSYIDRRLPKSSFNVSTKSPPVLTKASIT